MSRKYLLGIDNGGTVSKAALFDLSGRQILKKSVQIPMLTPAPGFTQRRMEDIRDKNFELIKSITDACDGEIAAVGFSGHGKGLYVLGEGGEFIYDGIGSTDTRALSYELMWKSDGTAQRIYPKTAQKIMACQPAALLRWMKDNEREVYDRIRCVLSVKDFIRWTLCGECFAEYTDASGTNLMNLRTLRFDEELFHIFGIPEMLLCMPEVRSSSEVCGYVSAEAARATGLREGTPVSGGMFDIDACAAAMGNLTPGDMCVIAGTWAINEYVSERICDDHTVSMNSVFCDPRYYLAEESSAASCGNLEWFRNSAGLGGTYAELDALAESVDPAHHNVIYLPFLYASNENPLAKATFVGLDGHHTKADIVRAVYEGVAFSHKTHINALLRSRSDVPGRFRLAGGVVNSAVWTQIFCDVIGIPAEIISGDELGAKGAAMSAGVAIGAYGDYEDAAKKCVSVSSLVMPDEKRRAVYEEKYKKYRAVADALDGVWAKL